MTSNDQYVNAEGNYCPVCQSPDITGGPVEIAAGSAMQEVSCNECDAVWADTYVLTGFVLQENEHES